MTKLTFFVTTVSAFLILQLSQSVPIGEKNPEHSPSGLQLLFSNALNKYFVMVKYSIEEYNDLFKKVLELSETEVSPNSKLDEALQPLRAVVKLAENSKDKRKSSMSEIFEVQNNIIFKYTSGLDDSEETTKIMELLNKSGLKKTIFNIVLLKINFVQNFDKYAQNYLLKSSDKRSQNDQLFLQWYEVWQKEHDFDKKFDLFEELKYSIDPFKDSRQILNEKLIEGTVTYLRLIINNTKDILKKAVNLLKPENSVLEESLQIQIDAFNDFIEKVEQFNQLKDEDKLLKMRKLFLLGQKIFKKYDRNDLTDNQMKVADILAKSGKDDFEMKTLMITFAFEDELIYKIEEYFNYLSEDELRNEKDLIDWVEDVISEDNYLKRREKLINIINFIFPH